ncbi:hypothetical protein RUM43_005121 [Polyplax serrata]|uniref:FXNA-like protease n=1 Tax=Polyplax serrata TaxID=468196 RepID=A0AAN8SCX8_POLSC
MDGGKTDNAINGPLGVRHRSGRSGRSKYESDEISSNSSRKSHGVLRANFPKSTPQSYVIIVYLLYAALFVLQIYLERYNYPIPLMLEDIEGHPNEFIAERAMDRLVKLTDIGPRVAGSYENEVLAVDLLKKEINKIIEQSNPVQTIELDVQKYSGSFPLRFLDGLTNVYKNVQDVIVKLGSKENSPHSLLMNCHFDSVPDSPGGSDDGAGCAVMLEILDVLSKSPVRLDNNVIFLFNGAEENLMHGSHGFITQHKWAKEVRAFVNLEACGAGGREVLFQSGPNSPWIMRVYSESVLHPFASSMAQEVFESGVIPGDTDFRVFRDFGNVSGLDFAWSTNGYVYHTKFDNVDQIPLGSLQRTGENILALVKGLANAEEMKDAAKHKEGNLIYFDLLGLYLIRWPEEIGTYINSCTVLLSLLLLCVSVRDARKKDIDAKTYIIYLLKTFAVVLLSSAASFVSVLCISGFVSLIGKSMSWYGRPIWLLLLYVLPSMTAVMSVQHYFSEKFMKSIRSRMVLFQMYFDVYQFLWTIILSVTIVLKIRSGYVAWMWVFGPCIGILLHRLVKSPLDRGPDWKWLIYLLLSVSLPVVQHANMQFGCLALFIPIMGRSGTSLNSEVVIALFANVTFGMLFAYVIPVVILVENPKKIFACMSGIFLAALLLHLFTPLGFPYTGDVLRPRPQRYMLVNTERSFYDTKGVQLNSEFGYWVVDHDFNSPHSVASYVPEMAHAVTMDKECDKYLYCGLPYLMPVLSFIRKTHWIPASPRRTEKPSSMTVISRTIIGENVERITLEIKGPDHMGLIISPKKNVELIRWSLNNDDPVKGPVWQGQDTYFVYYACSSDPEPWIVSFDCKVLSYNDTLMNLALTGHILHGPGKTNLHFTKMLAQFPSWTTVTAWTATYKSFIV